ncbi:MAG TPA: hypothetical protein VE178_13475 [Silvibacterium sp.]|jgi:uncharacterized protein YjgD (DUF1641 family)|nr:hypothetical protein [Silvibacterium sp.]
MAQPIPLEVAPRNAREELRNRLERAPDEHAEAILAAYELLQEMHDQGLLDIARGVLSARDEILGTLAADASTPEAVRAIRNLLFWRRVLGCIEPDRFQAVFEAIPEGFALATKQPKKPVRLFGLLRRLTEKDSLRAMAAAVDFLQCFGRRLLTAEKTTRD